MVEKWNKRWNEWGSKREERNDGECNHTVLSISISAQTRQQKNKNRRKRQIKEQQSSLFYPHNFSLLFFIFLSIFLSLSVVSSLLGLQWEGSKVAKATNRERIKEENSVILTETEESWRSSVERREKGRWREAEKQRVEGGLKVFICPLAGCFLNLKGCKACRREDIRKCNCREWKLSWNAQ